MDAAASPPGTSSALKIDLNDVPAVIGWDETLKASSSPIPGSLALDFDSASKTASLRFRIALYRRRQEEAVPVYLVVHFQQIQSIVEPVLPAQERSDVEPSRHETHRLLFHLDNPPILITPPEPLRLNDRTQTALLRSVRSAAQRRVFSLEVGEGVLSRAQLTMLCEAVYQNFHPSSRLSDYISLYHGKGGKVVDCTSGDDVPSENPPSYNELGAPPPMPPIADSDPATSSKKRRLSGPDPREVDSCLIENVVKKICAEQFTKLRAELSTSEARIVNRLDQRLNNRFSDLNDKCQTRLKILEDRIQDIRDEVSRLDEACHADMEQLDDRIQEVSDDVDRRVDFEVEDRVLGIKLEMEDFVKEELKNTEDALKHHLEEASLSLHVDW